MNIAHFRPMTVRKSLLLILAAAVLPVTGGRTSGAGPPVALRWNGTVTLTAPVTLGQGETLVVEAGTKVVLQSADRDGDGIGDVGITVSGGRVLIQGTAAQPVLFTGGGRPLPRGTWREILIENSPEVVITHAVFEAAHWPLQIHSSKVLVEHCVFRDNTEGNLRFREGEMAIRGNVFQGRGIGIRYHDSAPTIVDNLFATGKGIFFRSNCAGASEISGNRFACQEYDLQMGFFQEEPVHVGPNVFTRLPGEKLGDRIYDRADDPDLREIVFDGPATVVYVGAVP